MTPAPYTIGIVFSHNLKCVFLLRKNRPDWQAGKLNGIGGHIEEGEEPLNAMRREALEETGYKGIWIPFGVFHGDRPDPYRCHLFYSVMKAPYQDEKGCDHYFIPPRRMEDQEVEAYLVEDLGQHIDEMVVHLPVLIMGALACIRDKDNRFDLNLTRVQRDILPRTFICVSCGKEFTDVDTFDGQYCFECDSHLFGQG